MSDVETAQTGAEVAPVANAETPQATQVPESTTERVEALEQEKPRDEKGRFVPQERVNEITRARREAERQRDYYQQQLAQYQSQPQQHHQPQSNAQAPSISDYETVEAWAAAVLEHAERRADSRIESRWQQLDQQRQQQSVAQTFEVKEREFAAKTPDYLDRVSEMTSAVQFHPALLEAIGTSDHGPQLAYHLANHLDVADRLARMSPVAAAVELGRIESQLSSPKHKPVTNAPAPAPTVGGVSTAPKDPERMSVEEWMAARNKQAR